MHKLLFVLIFISSTLFGVEKNEASPELQSIEHLISLAKQNIELQENVRSQLIEYQKVNKLFLQNSKDNDLLFQNIKLGSRLLETINNAHLTQNFSNEFIKELTLFAKFAKKQGVPKP